MKRCMLLVVVFCLLLSMTACAAVPEEGEKPEATTPGASEPDTTEPDVTQPDTTEPEVRNPTVPDVKDPEEIELVYDLSNDQGLSDFFEEKTVEEWNSMGRYTLRLEGLHTPVVLNMDGTSVLSISAFDQTVDLGTDGMADDYHDGYSPVQRIRSTYDAVVIHVSFGEMGDGSILITKNQIFKYPKERDSSISFGLRTMARWPIVRPGCSRKAWNKAGLMHWNSLPVGIRSFIKPAVPKSWGTSWIY